MANTYTLINSTSLSSSAASVTFSSIPATYDDLLLSISARTDQATVGSQFYIRFNSDTSSATTYSNTRISGDGVNTPTSGRNTSTDALRNLYSANGSTATSNTFSSFELYVPSYRVSQNKPISAFNVAETNATTAYINANALLWRDTSAITQIVIEGQGNLVSGSTFWLYGIKNS